MAKSHNQPAFPVEPQTEIERLRRELLHAQRQAALGLAVASMAHEVNNLLTPVLTYAQMALRQPDNHELVQKALTRSAEGVQRASRISQSILRLAGQRENSGAAKPPHCDVASACMQALDSVMLGLQRDEIRVEVEIEPDLVAAIDSIELEHVLLNLLLNAQKAVCRTSSARSILVRCGVVQAADAARSTWSKPTRVQLEVRDTGPGIPRDVMQRLFEPFNTASAPAEQPGHGLGLMLCKHLIESAGGSVAGENPSTGGACFRIELPGGVQSQQPRRVA